MKKFLVFAALVLATLPLAASSEMLDPKEPVTLELRDAKLTDVITTLGAMANLTVVIEPGIEGTVTIQAEKVPFERILEILSGQNGISVRIEDGKLVASRVKEAPVAAPTLPEAFRDAPRVLLTDYVAAAAAPPPLLITTTWNGEEVCSIVRVGSGGGGILEIARSKASPEVLVVADMGYDPASKIRSIALEAAEPSMKQVFSLAAHDVPASVYKTKDGRSLRLLVSQAPRLVARYAEKGVCGQLVFRSYRGGAPATVSLEAAALSGDGTSSPVFSPRIQTAAGTVFKALGAEADSGPGQFRSYAVTGYVSRDGKSVALAFKARAIWTDPDDGRQYYFTQACCAIGFFPLTGFILPSAMPAGIATPRPLELRVFRGGIQAGDAVQTDRAALVRRKAAPSPRPSPGGEGEATGRP